MRKRAEVTSPDGERWVVSRQWVKGPKFHWGARRRPRSEDLDKIDISPFDVIDDSLTGIVLAFAAVVVIALLVALGAFVVLPVLGIALELIVVIVLLGYGITARVLFRRPWVIEAKNLDNPLRTREFKVVGWQRSREAIPAVERLVVSGANLESPGAQAVGAT